MTWTDVTTSNTTARNTSRFVLLMPNTNSATSGVDFIPAVRDTEASGRGVAAYVDDNDPIRTFDVGTTVI